MYDLLRVRCLHLLLGPRSPNTLHRRQSPTKRVPVRAIWPTALPQILGPPIGRLRRLTLFDEVYCCPRHRHMGYPIRRRCVITRWAKQQRPGRLVRAYQPSSGASLTNAERLCSTMGIFPIFMNTIQFWVFDSIIKVGGMASQGRPPDEEPASAETDQEPLFSDLDSDEDGDDLGAAPLPPVAERDVEAQQQRLRHSTESSHTYPPSLPGSPKASSANLRYTTASPPLSRSFTPGVAQRR